MSYTPPAGNAANFSWDGVDAYTAPAGSAADFSFVPPPAKIRILGIGAAGAPAVLASSTLAWAEGLPAAGLPGVLTSQQVAWVIGQPAAGLPQAQAWMPVVGWALPLPAGGSPQIFAVVPNFGRATATPAIGTPSALARTGFLALAQPLPALGIPQSLASWGYRLLAQPLPSLGTPRVFAWSLPAPAAIIPPGVTLYFCKITGAADGLADALLPISNFSVRHREATAGYYNVTIPSFAYVGALAARTHGEIVLWSERAGVTEELMRGALGYVSVARGPNSQSISISGNASRAATPSFTYVIGEALYTSTTFAGDTRLRIEPRAAIRPGDYVRYQELNFAVGEVSWSVAVSAGGMAVTMEVASLQVESGA